MAQDQPKKLNGWQALARTGLAVGVTTTAISAIPICMPVIEVMSEAVISWSGVAGGLFGLAASSRYRKDFIQRINMDDVDPENANHPLRRFLAKHKMPWKRITYMPRGINYPENTKIEKYNIFVTTLGVAAGLAGGAGVSTFLLSPDVFTSINQSNLLLTSVAGLAVAAKTFSQVDRESIKRKLSNIPFLRRLQPEATIVRQPDTVAVRNLPVPSRTLDGTATTPIPAPLETEIHPSNLETLTLPVRPSELGADDDTVVIDVDPAERPIDPWVGRSGLGIPGRYQDRVAPQPVTTRGITREFPRPGSTPKP